MPSFLHGLGLHLAFETPGIHGYKTEGVMESVVKVPDGKCEHTVIHY